MQYIFIMEQKYDISDILDAVNELNQSQPVKKVNNTKYRLFAGPFKNFNALKNIYISLNNLGFENLNIIKN